VTEVFLNLTEAFLTLTEVFPCVFLSCKANARVKLAKTEHGPHSSTLVCICVARLLFVLSMYCLCVNVYCHRVTTQLQLLNIISYFGQIYSPSSGILILYLQQLIFVILFMLTVILSNSMTNTNCYEYSIKTPDDGQ
jgi:hypothetical protein